MTQTDTQTTGMSSGFPTGDQIYDALMAQIEPDLLTVNLPTLKEKYRDEADEDRAARLQRYELAYFLYDQAFADWTADLHQTVHGYRRESLRSAEQKDRTHDQEVTGALEKTFVSAT